MNDKKDFFKISDLSQDYNGQLNNLLGADVPLQTRVQVWQATFLLACAQQLSVIASHLGKIVRKAEDKTHDEN